MLKTIHIALSSISLLFYAASATQGWEIATPQREVVPADVRHSPGGYRSFHFWHSGFHGGK